MGHGGQASRQTRALRGTVAAAIAVLIAATSHTLAGGPAPAPWLLVAVTLLAGPLAVWLVGRRPSLTRTALTVTASQLLLHASFAAVGDAGPAHVAHLHAHVAAGTLPALSASTGHHHTDAAMLLAHTIAAALTILLLSRGEAALRALSRGLHRLLARAVFRPRPVAAPLRLRAGAPAAPRTPLFLTALPQRGPPALSC